MWSESWSVLLLLRVLRQAVNVRPRVAVLDMDARSSCSVHSGVGELDVFPCFACNHYSN